MKRPRIGDFFHDGHLGRLKFLGDGPEGRLWKFRGYDRLQYGRWHETASLVELTPGQFARKLKSGECRKALPPL